MMTRKDFREIAQAIREALAMSDTGTEQRAIAHVARIMADTAKRSNPRFEYDTFYRACGLNEWGQPHQRIWGIPQPEGWGTPGFVRGSK